MTKNEIALMGKIYLIFNASQFLWDTSDRTLNINSLQKKQKIILSLFILCTINYLPLFFMTVM